MTSTRNLIIDHLEAKGTATVSELSRALRLTTANVRHHLNILMEQGSLVIVGQEVAGKRGRPAKVYALSQTTRRHSLHTLAGGFFDEFIQGKSPEEQAELLRKLAIRLIGDRPPTGLHLSQRLVYAVQRLNELNYQARWEAHADAPHMRLGHCPYADLVDQHPLICRFDAHLLRNLVGREVTQTARLEQDARGLPHCMFVVTSTRINE